MSDSTTARSLSEELKRTADALAVRASVFSKVNTCPRCNAFATVGPSGYCYACGRVLTMEEGRKAVQIATPENG